MRGTVYARATAQDAGYGLETELAEPDPALVEAAAPAVEALEQLLRPLVALGKRLEAVLEDAPDWLDAQARARVEGAIGGLAWRVQTLAGLDRARGADRRPGRSRFRRLARRSSGSRAANMTSACTATGSIRPGRSPKRCSKPAHGVLVTSATLRGGGRTGRAPRRAPARSISPAPPARFEAASPFDYAAHSEVLVVTDVKKGDLAALAGAYARLIEAARGRHAWACSPRSSG